MKMETGYTQRWESLLDTSRVFLFGITIVLGGQVFTWNQALTSCFWPYFSTIVITGLAYICFIFSLAEITSTLPFSGGSYGFVRVAIGPLWGYYVGWCEAIQNIFYISVTILTFGQVLCEIFRLSSDFEPFFWIFFFVTAFPLNFTTRQWFWRIITIFGMTTLLIILLYIFISIPNFDFQANAKSILSPIDNSSTFVSRILSSFAYVSWMFIGSEYMSVVCRDVIKPRQQIPHAMSLGIVSLVITGAVVFLMVSSTSPGIFHNAHALLPLNTGFAKAFHLSYLQASWFSVPAIYSTGLGFFVVCGRQISAMSRSGLVPSWSPLTRTPAAANTMASSSAEENISPLIGLNISAVSALVIMTVMHFCFPEDYTILQDICLLSSYVHYIFLLMSYLVAQKRYSLLERVYFSPFGWTGAMTGLLLFLVGIVSIVGFRERVNYAVEAFVGMSVMLFVLYFCNVQQRQSFSLDEQRNLFAAYLINANSRSRRKSVAGSSKHRKLQYSHSISSRAAKYSSTSSELASHQMTSPTSVVELSHTETPRTLQQKSAAAAAPADPNSLGLIPADLSPPLQLKVGSSDDAKELEDLERGKQHEKEEVKRHFSQFFRKLEPDEMQLSNRHLHHPSSSDEEDEDDEDDEEEANNAFEQKSLLRTFSTDAAKQALKYLLPNSMVRSPFMNKVLASFDEHDEFVSPPPRHPSGSKDIRKQSAPKVPAFRPFSMDDYDHPLTPGHVSTGNSLPSTGRRRSSNYLFGDVNNRLISSPSPVPHEGILSGPSTGRRRSNAPAFNLPADPSLDQNEPANLKSASEDLLLANDLSAASNSSLFQGQVKLKKKRKKAAGEDSFANQFLETVLQSNQFPAYTGSTDRENEIIRQLSHDYQQQHLQQPHHHHQQHPSRIVPPLTGSLAGTSAVNRQGDYLRLSSRSRSQDDYYEENRDDLRERCIRIPSTEDRDDLPSVFGKSIGRLDKLDSLTEFKDNEEDGGSRRSHENNEESDSKTEKLFRYLETQMEPLDGPSTVSDSFPLRQYPPVAVDGADDDDDGSLQLSQPDHQEPEEHEEPHPNKEKKEVPAELLMPLSEQGFQAP